MKKLYCISIIGILLVSLNTIVTSSRSSMSTFEDFDPLVDVSVSVEIKMIRLLAINELQTLPLNKGNDSPNFFVKVLLNDVEFTSDVWNDTKYVTDPQWNATLASHPKYYGYVYPSEQQAQETRILCRVHAVTITLDAIHR